jgi:ribonuclease P protein component
VPLQAGFTVSTRYFKRANKRNLVKRLLREQYRLQQLELASILHHQQLQVFFVYITNELPTTPIIAQKMAVAIKRLKQIVIDAAK